MTPNIEDIDELRAAYYRQTAELTELREAFIRQTEKVGFLATHIGVPADVPLTEMRLIIQERAHCRITGGWAPTAGYSPAGGSTALPEAPRGGTGAPAVHGL